MHALCAALRNQPTACFQLASKLGRAGVVPCTIIDLVYFSSFIASTPCVQCKLTIGGCSESYAHSRCYFGDLAEACLSCSINPRVMLCNAGQDMHRDALWALFAVASAVVLCFAAATPAVEHLSTIDYTRYAHLSAGIGCHVPVLALPGGVRLLCMYSALSIIAVLIAAQL